MKTASFSYQHIIEKNGVKKVVGTIWGTVTKNDDGKVSVSMPNSRGTSAAMRYQAKNYAVEDQNMKYFKYGFSPVSVDKNDRYNLAWLRDIVGIAPPKESSGIKEIEYTEEVAAFFVNMIKSICMMNERVKDFLTPDAIRMIAANQGQIKLIG